MDKESLNEYLLNYEKYIHALVYHDLVKEYYKCVMHHQVDKKSKCEQEISRRKSI